MRQLKRNIFIFVFLVTTLLISGCATMQRAKKVAELERQVAQLKQSLQEKDEQKKELQEQNLACKRQLERLQRELNELKARLEIQREEQLNLK